MTLSERICQIFPEIACEFQFGFEKEFLIGARHKESSTLYNLCLAPEFMNDVLSIVEPNSQLAALFSKGWTLQPEYSRCLLEAVSPAYSGRELDTAFDDLDTFCDDISATFASYVRFFHPRLAHYDCFLWTPGCSPSNLYLGPHADVLSKKTDSRFIVLPYCHWYLDLENMDILLGDVVEDISMYNHINSFNLTMHPQYSSDSKQNARDFTRFIPFCIRTFDAFKEHDNGNKTLIRDDRLIRFERNIRDIFLEQLFLYLNHGRPLRYEPPLSSQQPFEELIADFDNLESLEKLDESLKKWYVTNLRPRFIAGGIPCIEVKGFGSNYGSPFAKKLVQEFLTYGSY